MAKSKKKASKAAVLAIVLSIATALAVVFMALTNCFTDFSRFNRKEVSTPADNVSDTLYAPDKGLSITPTAANGIMLLSAPTPLADFAAYSLDENVEAVKTLTARFTPADTTLQKVDYTAAWKDSSNYWATGKDVNDYLKLTQSSDGSLDCAVSALQAFGAQIIITCTARPLEEGDTVPSATCTVDYYKRHYSCLAGLHGSYLIEDPEEGDHTVSTYGFDLGTSIAQYTDQTSETNDINVFPQSNTGTLNDLVIDNSINVKVSISENVAAEIKSAAGVSTLNTYSLVTNGNSSGCKIKTAINEILGGATNVNNHKVAIYNAFKEAYDNGQTVLKFELSYTTQVSSTKYTFNYENLFNPMALGVKAAGLDLDKPSIVL